MGDAAYKQRHRELGLCVECSKPALKNRTKCKRHLANNIVFSLKWRAANRKHYNKWQLEYKQKRIKDGRCRDCGRPMIEEEQPGLYHTCMNCRARIRRPQWVSHGINYS